MWENTHSSVHSGGDKPVICPLPYHSLPLSLQCHPLTLSICYHGNCTAPPPTHTHFHPKGHTLCHHDKGIRPPIYISSVKYLYIQHGERWPITLTAFCRTYLTYLLLFSVETVSRHRKIITIWIYLVMNGDGFQFFEVRYCLLLRYTCMRGTVAYIQEAGWIALEMDTA